MGKNLHRVRSKGKYSLCLLVPGGGVVVYVGD